MATLDATNATVEIDMGDWGLVGYQSTDASSPSVFSWITSNGTDIDAFSDNGSIGYGGDGLPSGGSISAIRIDIGNDNFTTPTS